MYFSCFIQILNRYWKIREPYNKGRDHTVNQVPFPLISDSAAFYHVEESLPGLTWLTFFLRSWALRGTVFVRTAWGSSFIRLFLHGSFLLYFSGFSFLLIFMLPKVHYKENWSRNFIEKSCKIRELRISDIHRNNFKSLYCFESINTLYRRKIMILKFTLKLRNFWFILS